MLSNVKSSQARPIRKSRAHPALTRSQSSVFTKYIGTLKVGRAEQLRMSLGVFGADRPAKGFSIEINPDPEPAETITTEVLAVGSATRHELFLEVANFGNKPITIEVWRI
jgi:hypothetical protein